MRRHRIHTGQELRPGIEVALEEGPAHYLGRVLRTSPGQGVILFNGDGHDYLAEVRRVSRREATLSVRERLPGLPEPRAQLVVVQAISRGERMDATLQKCTELGAAGFQLLLSERSEVRLDGERLRRRLDHWRGVVVSACEQSGRARVPPVREPLAIEDWLAAECGGIRLVLSPRGAQPLTAAGPAERYEIAVGPEGGFSDGELAQMLQRGVEAVGLGPRTLRTETAAPAAVAILQCLYGDLRFDRANTDPASR